MFAKWTDCRLYAARVLSINSNGKSETLHSGLVRYHISDQIVTVVSNTDISNMLVRVYLTQALAKSDCTRNACN